MVSHPAVVIPLAVVIVWLIRCWRLIVSNGRIDDEVDIASKLSGDRHHLQSYQFVREGEVLAKMDIRVQNSIKPSQSKKLIKCCCRRLCWATPKRTRAAAVWLINARQNWPGNVTHPAHWQRGGNFCATVDDDRRAAAESAWAALESAKARFASVMRRYHQHHSATASAAQAYRTAHCRRLRQRTGSRVRAVSGLLSQAKRLAQAVEEYGRSRRCLYDLLLPTEQAGTLKLGGS